ncbi:MAG: hypothetical protein EXR43_01855 [Dehalococcoidia bacterium]|nr:hypothetical protein [Dehalococcoidia bacterium]
MDWWLDFISWIEHHDASVTLFASLALIVVTAVYAFVTWRIVGATRKQAEASEAMAKEMREQRSL